jgi:hypothetical protein
MSERPLSVGRTSYLMSLWLEEDRHKPLPCPIPPCPERGDRQYLTVHVRIAHPEPEATHA